MSGRLPNTQILVLLGTVQWGLLPMAGKYYMRVVIHPHWLSRFNVAIPYRKLEIAAGLTHAQSQCTHLPIHTARRVVSGTDVPIHMADADHSLFQLITRHIHHQNSSCKFQSTQACKYFFAYISCGGSKTQCPKFEQ